MPYQAETYMVADAFYAAGGDLRRGWYHIFISGSNPTTTNVAARHNDRANMLYCDGHVKTVSYSETCQPYPDFYTRPPWNFRLSECRSWSARWRGACCREPARVTPLPATRQSLPIIKLPRRAMTMRVSGDRVCMLSVAASAAPFPALYPV